MSKILGIDYGKKQIGIAISDADRILAFPRETISHDKEQGIEKIVEYAKKEGTEEIVCGLPIGMTGEETPQTQETREFAKKLEEKGLKVAMEDERLTTQIAEQSGGTRENVDMLAAQLILQTYLDRTHAQESKKKKK